MPNIQARFVLTLLGDSLTEGYGLLPSDALPLQVQRSLDARGVSVEVRNAGVSGETSANGLARFDRVTAESDGVVIQFGGNDMLQGRSPSSIRADLASMITRAKSAGLWVGLVGMKAPPIAGAEYQSAFDALYRDLADEHLAPLYPFYFEGLIDVQTGERTAGLFIDRIHPSKWGVAIVAEGMAAWLTRVLPSRALGA